MADDIKTRVVQMVKANPAMSAAEIARALRVTRQYVHRILVDLGYRQEWREGPEYKAKRGKP